VALANALVMSLYSLWINWTTVYFVQERGLTVVQANQQFAWLPPVFATLGGFFGGWLAYRAIRQQPGDQPDGVRPRLRICWAIAPVLLVTATVPLIESTLLASAAMALSFFGCLAIVNNLQMIPLDLFGPRRAAFTGSVLTCSYALMQTVVSPAIGSLVDTYGFGVVCIAMSIMPLLGVVVLTVTLRNSAPAPVRSVVPA
jgi:MFS transporter, ACS family, hexuronate transporter